MASTAGPVAHSNRLLWPTPQAQRTLGKTLRLYADQFPGGGGKYVKNLLFFNTKIAKTCIFEVVKFKIIKFALLTVVVFS